MRARPTQGIQAKRQDNTSKIPSASEEATNKHFACEVPITGVWRRWTDTESFSRFKSMVQDHASNQIDAKERHKGKQCKPYCKRDSCQVPNCEHYKQLLLPSVWRSWNRDNIKMNSLSGRQARNIFQQQIFQQFLWVCVSEDTDHADWPERRACANFKENRFKATALHPATKVAALCQPILREATKSNTLQATKSASLAGGSSEKVLGVCLLVRSVVELRIVFWTGFLLLLVLVVLLAMLQTALLVMALLSWSVRAHVVAVLLLAVVCWCGPASSAPGRL